MVVLVSKYLLIIQEVRKLGPELLTRSLVSKVPHSGARGCLRPAPHWGEGPGALYWLSLRTLERENIPVKPVELWPAPSMGLATLTPVTRKEEPYRVTLPKVPLTGKTGKLSVGSQCEASGEPQSSHRETRRRRRRRRRRRTTVRQLLPISSNSRLRAGQSWMRNAIQGSYCVWSLTEEVPISLWI